jgi:hypothetical protein
MRQRIGPVSAIASPANTGGDVVNIEEHRARARRIQRSLDKCALDDFEMKIEGAMLAGTHWLNAALHRSAITAPDKDVFHTYLLTVNEFRRLSVADRGLMNALVEIEDLRPAFVRGNFPGGQQAAQRALDLLAMIRSKGEKE